MRATVVGAGLAGCEAAWQLAMRGVEVTLIEQKPRRRSPAHHTDLFAELVCSNSLKAERIHSAGGLLKAEMRRLGSLMVETAYACRVPAGGALAVDRTDFAAKITAAVNDHPLITVQNTEQVDLPEGVTIIATGPLTDGALAERIAALAGQPLSFYDAAAPIVTKDSIDFDCAFCQSRYDREDSGDGDYINCPMNREEYEAFHVALVAAEPASLHGFDRPPKVYEGCMPVEIMAARGPDTLCYGPLKPVGLRDPRTGHRPWANVQLRRENSADTLYNLVGFQTNLKFSEQKRVFSMIPALCRAEFMRFGVMHRNTFLDSPRLLGASYAVKTRADLFFAGQITGVEGYMESAGSGLLAGLNAFRLLCGQLPLILPATTMLGALAAYISDPTVINFQPMGANFGLLPTLDSPPRDKQERYKQLAERALAALNESINQSKPEETGG